MAEYEKEKKLVKEQISDKQTESRANELAKSESGVIAKLRHSSNIVRDLAALYADRPYVYARVVQELGRKIGIAQVKRIHQQVLGKVKIAQAAKDNRAKEVSKKQAVEQKKNLEDVGKKALFKKAGGGAISIPTFGGGGPTVAPKGEGGGSNAIEAFANSGTSYQLENLNGLGGKVDEDLAKDKEEIESALPGEEGAEISDSSVDAALEADYAATKAANETKKNTTEGGTDSSVDVESSTANVQADAEAAKAAVNSASTEGVPEKPVVEADYSAIEAATAEESEKYAKAQTDGSSKMESMDHTLKGRGYDDIKAPKPDLEFEAETIESAESELSASVASLSEEAKGIIDVSEFAEQSSASMESAKSQVAQAEETRKAETEAKIAEHEQQIAQEIAKANEQEQQTIAQQQAELDAQMQAGYAEYEAEISGFNAEQQGYITEAKAKIDTEKASAQAQIDSEHAKAQNDKTNAENEAHEAEAQKKDKAWWEKALDWAKDKVDKLINGLKDLVASIVNIFKQAVCRILDTFVAFVSSINSELGEKLRNAVEKYKEYLDKFCDALIAKINELLDALAQLIKAALDVLIGVIAGIVEAFKEAISAIWDALKAAFSAALDIIKAALTGDIGEFFKMILRKACELAGVDGSIVDRVAESAKKIIEDPGTFFSTLVQGFGEGFSLFFTNIESNILTCIKNLLTMWLGTAGISLPELSIAGIVKFALEVLGVDVDSILSTLGLTDVYKEISKQTKFNTPNLDEALKVKEDPRLELDIRNAEASVNQLRAKLDAGGLSDEDKEKLNEDLAAALRKKNDLISKKEKTVRGAGDLSAQKEKVEQKEEGGTETEIERFVNDLKANGLKGFIPYVMQHAGDLLADLTKSVIQEIVKSAATKAIAKLALMANPVGGIIAAVKAVWDLIQFVRSNMSAIGGLASALLDGLCSAANGDTGYVASAVQAALCQAIPLAVDLVLRLAGIDVGGKIKSILEKIQKKVKSAVDKVLNPLKAKAADFAKKQVQNARNKLEEKGYGDGEFCSTVLASTERDLERKSELCRAKTQHERDVLQERYKEEDKADKLERQRKLEDAADGGSRTAEMSIWANNTNSNIDARKKAKKDRVFDPTKLSGALNGNREGTLGVNLNNSKRLQAVKQYYDGDDETRERYEEVKKILKDEVGGDEKKLTKEEKEALNAGRALEQREAREQRYADGTQTASDEKAKRKENTQDEQYRRIDEHLKDVHGDVSQLTPEERKLISDRERYTSWQDAWHWGGAQGKTARYSAKETRQQTRAEQQYVRDQHKAGETYHDIRIDLMDDAEKERYLNYWSSRDPQAKEEYDHYKQNKQRLEKLKGIKDDVLRQHYIYLWSDEDPSFKLEYEKSQKK